MSEESEARIRPFKPEDSRLARFYIAKSSMEGLTAANTKFYTHPLVVALWVGLACLMIELLGWWPSPELGYAGWLRPIPAFACMALPIMFGADWFNRKSFDDQTQELIRSTDLVDISAYYSRSPSSSFWILEYGTKFVGLIAVDASKDSTNHAVVITESRVPGAIPDYTKGTSSVATVRHFYVEELYRKAGVQDALLEHALAHCWQSSDAKKVEAVKGTDSVVTPYIGKSLRSHGFKLLGQIGKVGMMGWELKEYELRRTAWEERTKAD